jgi:hypothetical protein
MMGFKAGLVLFHRNFVVLVHLGRYTESRLWVWLGCFNGLWPGVRKKNHTSKVRTYAIKY